MSKKEPEITFRASDKAAIDVLGYYFMQSVRRGSSRRHQDLVMDTIEEFQVWQDEHPSMMHIPDAKRPHGLADA